MRGLLSGFLGLSILLSSTPSFAFVLTDARRARMERDYKSNIFLLTLPPEVRQRAGGKIAMVGAIGTAGLLAVSQVSKNMFTGLHRKIFGTVLKIGVSLGVILIVDGSFAYMTDGKILPISMAFDELINIIKPAHAATLGDYFLETGENYQEFLKIGAHHGVEIMAMNPQLEATVQIYAEACREISADCP